MTKKPINIFSIIFIFFLLINYLNFINKNKKTIAVVKETSLVEENNYYDYYVYFNESLNTKNFNNKFKKFRNIDYKIKKIYSDPKNIYDEALKNKLIEYSFDSIENFNKYCIDNFNKYKLYDNIINMETYGIKINKVLLNTSKSNIKKMKIINNIITYKQKRD